MDEITATEPVEGGGGYLESILSSDNIDYRQAVEESQAVYKLRLAHDVVLKTSDKLQATSDSFQASIVTLKGVKSSLELGTKSFRTEVLAAHNALLKIENTESNEKNDALSAFVLSLEAYKNALEGVPKEAREAFLEGKRFENVRSLALKVTNLHICCEAPSSKNHCYIIMQV